MHRPICSTCQEPFEPPLSGEVGTCPKCAGAAQSPPAQGTLAPHRAEKILALAMLAVFVLPPVFGPVVWFMARKDLRRMRRGEMDPAGLGLTKAGWLCGLGATLISAALLALICALVGLLIYLEWLAASYEAN